MAFEPRREILSASEGPGKVLAERVGFEPTIPVKVCPLSRRIVSTTHAPLRIGTIKLFAVISWTARSVLRCAQDFACRLPLRSRPQPGSISTTHAPLRAVQSKPTFRTTRSPEANDLHSRRACFHLLLRKKSCKIWEHPLASTPFRSPI